MITLHTTDEIIIFFNESLLKWFSILTELKMEHSFKFLKMYN